MPKSCCAMNCTTRFKPGAGISFYKFPKDPIRKQKWINALRRKDWAPSKHTVICDLHFKTRLPSKDENHPDYAPSIFSFTEKYEKRKKRCEEDHSEIAAAEALVELNVSAGSKQSEIYEEIIPEEVCSETVEDLREEIRILKKKFNEAYISASFEISSLKEENKILRDKLSRDISRRDISSLLFQDQKLLKYLTGIENKETLEFLINSTVDLFGK